MSQPPVPPPGPGWGPGYGPQQQPPRKGHALELIVGAVLGGVDVLLAGGVGLGIITSVDNGVWFFLPLVLGLALPVALLFSERTRWWGLGILIGFFLTLIVLGGACVAIISTLGG